MLVRVIVRESLASSRVERPDPPIMLPRFLIHVYLCCTSTVQCTLRVGFILLSVVS